MISGTLFLGDTPGCRQLLSNWRALNELWRSRGITQGGGQKNLWFTSTCMDDLRIMGLPGAYCYAFDRAEFYLPGTKPIIEHTIASRDHRAQERCTTGRARRVSELRALLKQPIPQPPQVAPSTERIMDDPMRKYWTNRYQRQGKTYVARAGAVGSYAAQRAALAPPLRTLLGLGGKRMLDFGCGPGRFRQIMEEGGREYVGVDLIPGLGTQALTDHLPRGFDCGVAIMVLQHIVDPEIYAHWVRELFACLNLGGRLIVVDHKVQAGMEAHMAPRGIEGLKALAPWSRTEIVGEYDGHWIGYLVRGPAMGDSYAELATQYRDVAYQTAVGYPPPGPREEVTHAP